MNPERQPLAQRAREIASTLARQFLGDSVRRTVFSLPLGTLVIIAIAVFAALAIWG